MKNELAAYKRKRAFNHTPEPEGNIARENGALRFVVQKHDATRLHYDFRLEVNGVLKSWAVPKGPSQNPDDKRLAMMVEDHPYDYRTFEGIIPEGNYGAGTVMVWDEGTYTLLGEENEEMPADRKALEKAIAKQLKAGNLKIVLNGEKLHGAFALVKMKGKDMDDNAWLLIKKHDHYATGKDILEKDRSAVTGRTLLQIAKNKADGTAGKKNTRKTAVKKKSSR